ncbi:hypothetical protein ACUN0C_16905 [Faunimonas sp. B44]|uniref:hypothetical protein n=1 Tax=Faunimonas sp. B44 TaxID=3461493 RepID=UPI004043A1A1
MPKRRYIHIGYPKCASTSIQITFFPDHPELYHLGNGWNKNNNRYIDDAVTNVAEVDLRYKREFIYDSQQAKAAFEPHFEAAEADEKTKAVGLSSEFLSFTLGNEVDVVTKAKRLHEIFGDDTCVVFVFREQLSLLKSLYTEMVKGGYPGTFRKFLEYTYLFQDRNWCREFCFDKVFDLYAGLFGRENVCAVPFELLKADEKAFVARLCDGIGVSRVELQMRELNKQGPSLGVYELMRRFNEKFPHEFGGAFYEPFSCMRMRTYFQNELGVAVPHERAADDFIRMPLSKGAQQLQQHNPAPDIDLNFPPALVERLTAIYAPSNARLAEQTGVDLAGYGYRLP